MSKRNVVWLVAIVAAGVVLTVALSWVWGLIGAGVTLVISEVVERSRRRRRRAGGNGSGSPLREAIDERRRKR